MTRRMRHKNNTTTLDIYTHLVDGQRDAAQTIGQALQRGLREYRKDSRARCVADNTLLALLTDDLRAVHRLADPSRTFRRVVPPLAGTYLRFQAARPHRPHRSWSDHFGTRHPRPLDVETLGHRPRGARVATTKAGLQ
ncbi:hypothetical protein [Nocardia cyriacigeorgica]|uniref:hypothetical protein n=1 Tax=Nocardia cyriacigeorgica TaxID=135487 RepID=UPI002457844E|nr:hypothetical protein [Nocardia cyriacigeorgica]